MITGAKKLIGNMKTEERVRKSFIDQADICGRLGSRFMEHLLAGLGERIDKSSRTGKRVLEWQGEPEGEKDALALRLAGALHAIVRRGEIPELAEYYQTPQRAGEPAFISLVLAAIAKKDEEIASWLDFAPQTNETARAAVIYAGLSSLTETYQLPVRLFELGSSGGLNLQAVQFGYEFSGKQFGDPNSPVQLKPDWQGGLPPDVKVQVVSRNGCDLNPLSVENSCKTGKNCWPISGLISPSGLRGHRRQSILPAGIHRYLIVPTQQTGLNAFLRKPDYQER